MRHRVVTPRSGGARAALAGLLVGLLALPALPSVAGAQAPPPDPAPPAADEAPADRADPSDPDPAEPPADDGLGEADRALVAEARAADEDVTLLVAAEDGRVDEAARQLRAEGAEVEVVDGRTGYLKATLPADDAVAAAKAPAIEAVDVDGLIDRGDPVPAGAQVPSPQTPPGAGTPAVNPYLPTGDIGAPQFVAANPTFDGRGTVVAIIDSGVDLDSAALAATTTAGQPKIVDWFNANDPASGGDGTWVTTTGRHTGTFTADGRTWTAPATGGPYSFGVLVETAGDLAGGELGGDVDRDGVTGERIGVVQDRTTLEVYVDVDQDRDLSDEVAMLDFADGNRDVGFLGTDDPGTPVHERVAFVVGTHESNVDPASGDASWVSLGIAGSHGTHVAGIATGHGILGGAMDGVAPGAQVMSIRACLTTTSCTSGGILDGISHAAQNGADVANMSIGGILALNDGNNARAEIIDRTIADYDMQLVISAGNDGPGSNTVGDPGVATSALTVGASITDDTWRANYGSDSATPLALMPFSSRGPREDGGFKPDVVAPGAAIAPIPPWQDGRPIAGTYGLPAGYGLQNGTSMAAPQVTGAAALLVGAHKATHGGARPDPAALRDALRGSATPIPGVGVHEQGTGLVDVAAAWDRLQAGHAPHAITATVPSGSPLAAFLKTPGVGVGIHERDGMVAGGPDRTRTYTVTRTSGPAGTVVVPVTWIGNDGTFTAPSHVALPRDTPVPVPVTIGSATAGAHSAAMVLDDPATPGTDLITMNAAFVAQPFVDGVATLSGTVPRNGTRHLFLAVPARTGSLVTTLTGGGAAPGAGQVRFLRYHPYGQPTDPTTSTSCYTPDAGAGCTTGSPTNRQTTNPQAGVWEIVVEARRTSDGADAPFTLTATIGAATISPRRDLVGPLDPGTTLDRTYTVTNGPTPVRARLTGGPLASTRYTTPDIADGAAQQYQIAVTPGATSLSARIGSPSDAAADLDLVLYNCSTGTCVLSAQSAGGDSEETVTVANPAAGVWIALVDGYSVPAGTTTFEYHDSFTAPPLGSVSVADAEADRAPGASWTATATVTANGSPAAGRFLTGPLQVVTDDGFRIGTGEVVLLAPGPVSTTTVSTSPSPSVAGEPVTLRADVSARGSVTFFDGGTPIGTVGVSGGVARLTTSALTVGSHAIRASLAAAGVYTDSQSSTVTHVVTAAPPVAVPTADAGEDQVVEPGDTVTLDGEGSTHPDDEDLTHAWVQETGPTVALTGADTATPSFTAPDTTEPLTFRLVVTAPDGRTGSDTVVVDVNQAPTADAGEDASTNPGTVTALDGTGSTDPDGDPLTHSWIQISGPAVTLTGADTATPSFTAPDSGAVSFRLTVSDGSRNATDTVTVTVNGAPTAAAGPDRKVNPGTTATVDGSGSTDPDDDALSHAWTQTAGPAVTLTGAGTATPSFTVPATGAVTLQLTVTDPLGLADTDTVVVTANATPEAAAGDDQVVAPSSTVTLDASGSTDPGDVLSYTWQQHDGPTVALSSAHVASPSFTAPAAPATLVFTVTVVDPLGLVDTDLVTVRVAAPVGVDARAEGTPNPGAEVTLVAEPTGDDAGSLAYAWTQTAGPAVTLGDADEAEATFTAPGSGTLTFSVTVTDGLGRTATDTVTVAVNRAPSAAAGDDRTVNPGTAVDLAGGGSDPDADALTHGWTQVAGPAVTLAGATTATPSFTAPAGPATLTFRLTVTDARGLTATDDVTITVNGAPLVDAGEDRAVDPDVTVTLDGTGTTDPDGDDLEYLWNQDAGPIVALTGIDTATPTFVAPAGPVELTFTLTATDEGGATGTDTVTIAIGGVPVADAGDDRTVNPATTATLDGSGSSDPDGGAVTHAWTQTDGIAVVLAGADTATPSFTAPAGPATLTFRLTVTDDRGLTATDDVTVTVNGVPEAVAGPAQTVDQGTTVTLDASGSTDPDDDALTYTWVQDAGPAVALTGADTAAPTFTAPAGPASLLFLVSVTDAHGAHDVASVTITVVPPLTADEEWVVEVYSTFLHRVPDPTGLAYWADRLEAGTSRTVVLRNVALSAEATRGPVVTDLYDRLLDRTPGADERAYWAGRLADGTRHHWIERHLLASAERLAASGGTDTAYVSDLYLRVLGRTGGEAEIAYWVDRLGSGAPRLHTVDALLNTPEARAVRVAEVAEAILGRPATEDERDDLGAVFAAGRDPRTVAMAAFLLRD
jgi:subtilisin family serine protease